MPGNSASRAETGSLLRHTRTRSGCLGAKALASSMAPSPTWSAEEIIDWWTDPPRRPPLGRAALRRPEGLRRASRSRCRHGGSVVHALSSVNGSPVDVQEPDDEPPSARVPQAARRRFPGWATTTPGRGAPVGAVPGGGGRRVSPSSQPFGRLLRRSQRPTNMMRSGGSRDQGQRSPVDGRAGAPRMVRALAWLAWASR